MNIFVVFLCFVISCIIVEINIRIIGKIVVNKFILKLGIFFFLNFFWVFKEEIFFFFLYVVGIIFCVNWLKIGFVISVIGIVIIILYNKILFIFVLSFLVMIMGLGCGGKNLCVIDNVVIIGSFNFNIDIFVCLVIVNMSGINSIRFILKNSVILMINVVINIVYWICFWLNFVISVLVICVVLLLLVNNLFNIVFKLKIKVIWFNVLFILFLMVFIILLSGIFNNNVVIIEVMINEINVLSFNLIINVNKIIIFNIILMSG